MGLGMIPLCAIWVLGQAKQIPVIERTEIDANHVLAIYYSDGKKAQPPKQKDQVGVSSAAVAEDKQTVGYLVQYENSGTSYPVPLSLVLYKSGKILQRFNNGRPISEWYFWSAGTDVAIHTTAVHGAEGHHFALYDVGNGRLIDEWTGLPNEKAPKWVHHTKYVSTILGVGMPGFSDDEVNNPYGLVIGPDNALYFCDLDNQRIRRRDPATKHVTTIAGSGERAYKGDGGPAVAAALNMPHELRFDKAGNLYIAERDNHVIRKVDMKTGIISTVAGTGAAGFSGDGGPGTQAQLRQPHSIVFDADGTLLICDIGNQRIRRLNLTTGLIDTYSGTGEAKPTPEGAPVRSTPLNGPRTMAVAPNGDLYLALREGNAIYRIDAKTQTLHRMAGTGAQGYSGDGEPVSAATFSGPKGLALSNDNQLYIADTENHVIRRLSLDDGRITTVMGTGERGDGPESDPLKCKLSRPHGVFVDVSGVLYVSDSESHRIRILK